jgi:phosphorylcholine metabolism protein LicD
MWEGMMGNNGGKLASRSITMKAGCFGTLRNSMLAKCHSANGNTSKSACYWSRRGMWNSHPNLTYQFKKNMPFAGTFILWE